MKLREKLEHTQRRLESVSIHRDELDKRSKQLDAKSEDLTSMLLAEKADLLARVRRINVLLRANGYRERTSISPESYR